MWDDERQSSAPIGTSVWMEAIKSSSSSSYSSSSSTTSSSSASSRNHINNLSTTRINRSSPSINFIVNSDDEDYAILPPSPPINRTPYSRLKGKARSRSSSRVPLVPLESTLTAPTVTPISSSDGPTSMIQKRQSPNHVYNNNNNSHPDRDYSSFDCYQMDANRNQMIHRADNLHSSERNLLNGNGSNNMARNRNRENIYGVLNPKKLLDTQRSSFDLCTLSTKAHTNGTNLIKTPSRSSHQLSPVKRIDDLLDIDANNLTSDALIEREWNKLVNGRGGSPILWPLTPATGKKLNPNQTSLSLTTETSRGVKSSAPKSNNSTNGDSICNDNINKANRLNGIHNQQQQYNGTYDFDSYFEDTGGKMIKANGQKNGPETQESRTAKIVNLINTMNNQFNSLNPSPQSLPHCVEKANVPGTRFKEILKLYENLGKCSVYDSLEGSLKSPTSGRRIDSPIEKDLQRASSNVTLPSSLTTNSVTINNNNHNGDSNVQVTNASSIPFSGSESNDESVRPSSRQNLKSTIMQLDSVCQNRLKSIEEFQAKVASLREEIYSKEQVNGELKAERDRLQIKLEEAQSGWKDEVEHRRRESETVREVNQKLRSRLDRLTRELEESNINYDYLEMAYNRLKAEVTGLQEIHSSEVNLMKERLNDLTAKLVASERSLKKAKSYIGKLESRKRRSLSMRSPRTSSLISSGSGSKSAESINELNDGKVNGSSCPSLKSSSLDHSTSNNNNSRGSSTCIPKDFQHKLQELECKIARIQVILLANEHQSPDEGLPDLESIHTSFPSTLTTSANQQLIEITPPPPTSSSSTIDDLTSLSVPTSHLHNSHHHHLPRKVENVPSQITIK